MSNVIRLVSSKMVGTNLYRQVQRLSRQGAVKAVNMKAG